MGNRAVITTQKDLDSHGVGVYLHWNGGYDSVKPLLDYCRMRGFRSPDKDDYGYARMVQVMANFLGGDGCSIGVGLVDHMDQDNWDNGVYVIEGWSIVGRLFAPSEEQNGYDHAEFLLALDMAQPEQQRIGVRMMSDLVHHGCTLPEATCQYHYRMQTRKERKITPQTFEVGRRYKRYECDTTGTFTVVGKDDHVLKVERNGREELCPLFHWADGGESIILPDANGPRPVEPIQEASR